MIWGEVTASTVSRSSAVKPTVIQGRFTTSRVRSPNDSSRSNTRKMLKWTSA